MKWVMTGTRTVTIPIVPQKDATGDFSESTLKLFKRWVVKTKGDLTSPFSNNVLCNKRIYQNALGSYRPNVNVKQTREIETLFELQNFGIQ